MSLSVTCVVPFVLLERHCVALFHISPLLTALNKRGGESLALGLWKGELLRLVRVRPVVMTKLSQFPTLAHGSEYVKVTFYFRQLDCRLSWQHVWYCMESQRRSHVALKVCFFFSFGVAELDVILFFSPLC